MSGRRGSYRDDEIPTLYVRQVHYSARPYNLRGEFLRPGVTRAYFFRPDDLRALFERMGPVRDVYIPLDYYTRESRGFAYVKFEFTRDAEDALRELNGASILGRRIEIEWAEGQRKTKTEMRARDSYNSYRARNRYRSRSPYKSRHEHSPRRRSCSRRNSHSRSKRRSHNSRRRHYSKSRRHHSNARSRNSRSTRSSSASVRKKRNSQKIERSKSPLASGSLLYSLNEIKDSSDEKQNIIVNEYNRQNAEKLKESVDELEIRSETRISDVEINEKEIQEAVQTNGSIDYIDDHVGVEVNGSNASATEAEEEDKIIMDIEVIDEIVEQSGIFFNDTVVEGVCLDDNINVQELLITDTTN